MSTEFTQEEPREKPSAHYFVKLITLIFEREQGMEDKAALVDILQYSCFVSLALGWQGEIVDRPTKSILRRMTQEPKFQPITHIMLTLCNKTDQFKYSQIVTKAGYGKLDREIKGSW